MRFSRPEPRRKPSPALVIALIALFVSLSGTATAATIIVTSKNIKNGTIQVVDMSKKARTALKGNRGAQGSTGPQGAAGATNVTVRSFNFTVSALGSAFAFVTCASGQRATGGGGRAAPGVLIYETHPANATGGPPSADGETPVGWRVGVDNFINSAQTFTVYAVCAAP